MNGPGKMAKLRYLDGHFDIMEGGDYVQCAVSGQMIQLSKLKYWSVDRQEAYATAEAAFARETGQGDG